MAQRTTLISPVQEFFDPSKGRTLAGGTLYIGAENSDPKNDPLDRYNVYNVNDDGTEILISQPIPLNGAGQPSSSSLSGNARQIRVELPDGVTRYCVQAFSNKNILALYQGSVAMPTGNHQLLTSRNAVGAHDDIYIRTVTLAEAQAEDAPVGTRYILTDLDSARYNVVSSGDAGGFYITTMASGRKLSLSSIINVTPKMFGCKGDYNGTVGTLDAVPYKAWLEYKAETKLGNKGAWYWLGEIAGDTALATTTGIDHNIDFNYSKISCKGQTGAVYTATAVLKVIDGLLSAENIAYFDDESFPSRGSGRGVVPFIVLNQTKNTSGYKFDSLTLNRAQAFCTFVGENGFKATAINIDPNCIILSDCERGLTLSESGSFCSGGYTLPDYTRALFTRNVQDVNLKIKSTGNGRASSGNLMLINPENFDITLDTNLVNTVSILVDSPNKTIKNIDVYVKARNSNSSADPVVRIGEQDGNGSWLTNGTYTIDGVRVKTRIPRIDNEFSLMTVPATVLGNIEVDSRESAFYARDNNKNTAFIINDTLKKYNEFNVSSQLEVDVKRVVRIPSEGSAIVTVRASQLNGQYKDERRAIQYTMSSGGVFSIAQSTLLSSAPVGGPNPNITIGTLSSSITASVDTYTGNVGISLSFEKDTF